MEGQLRGHGAQMKDESPEIFSGFKFFPNFPLFGHFLPTFPLNFFCKKNAQKNC